MTSRTVILEHALSPGDPSTIQAWEEGPDEASLREFAVRPAAWGWGIWSRAQLTGSRELRQLRNGML